MITLVTGAAGKTGQAVMRSLVARGQAVRAFVRAARAAAPLQALTPDVQVGDLLDVEALRRAAAGARAIYHLCPNMHPDEIAIGRNVIEAARAADVEHLVYHSVLHPQTEAMPHHWHKLRVEEALFESGLPVILLQPAPYMQNLLGVWPSVIERGAYPVPYPAPTRLSLVDVQDVGDAAATVLTEPGHVGATYELCGTPGLTQTQVAEALSAGLGRAVRVEALSLDEWEAQAPPGLSADKRAGLKAMFRYYAAYGLVGNPNTLRWLLRREPTPLAEFVARTAREGSVSP